MSEPVLEFLRRKISELINCDESEVTSEAKLVEDLGFESIDFLELSMTLSQHYRIDMDEKTAFLSGFRPIATGGAREQVLKRLAEAYPHLPESEIERILDEAPHGKVLNVSHLAYYIEHQRKRPGDCAR
ncbi:MAG: phosphopantetheine-binding protein [Syntrophobacteraceae bacterium]|nr:phosphopantetheine-binding protein [Desulfobacteraceae bacterium]